MEPNTPLVTVVYTSEPFKQLADEALAQIGTPISVKFIHSTGHAEDAETDYNQIHNCGCRYAILEGVNQAYYEVLKGLFRPAGITYQVVVFGEVWSLTSVFPMKTLGLRNWCYHTPDRGPENTLKLVASDMTSFLITVRNYQSQAVAA